MDRNEREKQKQDVYPTVQVIQGEQCIQLEPLWREVFYEDSDQFTEYYYTEKVKANRGLFIENEIEYQAMMFLTPYEMQIGTKQEEISYIIGVATKEKYRHRGMMNQLLRKSFEMLYNDASPFTFLMPANPAIYEPYEFRYIYDKVIYSLNTELISQKNMEQIIAGERIFMVVNGRKISVTSLQYEKDELLENSEHEVTTQLNELVEFANEWLQEHKQVYTLRTPAYYKMQYEESKAQNGAVVLLRDENGICGFFLYAKEGDIVEIQEVMMLDDLIDCDIFIRSEQKKPTIMARIICVQSMLSYLRSTIPLTIEIAVSDPIIEQNNGVYYCEVDCNGCIVTQLKNRGELKAASTSSRGQLQVASHDVTRYEYQVDELVQVLFGYKHNNDFSWLLPLDKVFINEIV